MSLQLTLSKKNKEKKILLITKHPPQTINSVASLILSTKEAKINKNKRFMLIIQSNATYKRAGL